MDHEQAVSIVQCVREMLTCAHGNLDALLCVGVNLRDCDRDALKQLVVRVEMVGDEVAAWVATAKEE